MTLTTAPSTSISVTAAERGERLSRAGSAWHERIAADATTAHLTYRVTGTGVGSVATAITSGRQEFLIDEPGALAGDDTAASPVEFALGALISCQVVVYRLYANALGIPFDDISIVAEGDLDARRLFGIEENVRAGFTAVRLAVTIVGPETQARYEQLRDVVDAHCPVRDLFTNPTPVSVTVTKASSRD